MIVLIDFQRLLVDSVRVLMPFQIVVREGKGAECLHVLRIKSYGGLEHSSGIPRSLDPCIGQAEAKIDVEVFGEFLECRFEDFNRFVKIVPLEVDRAQDYPGTLVPTGKVYYLSKVRNCQRVIFCQTSESSQIPVGMPV